MGGTEFKSNVQGLILANADSRVQQVTADVVGPLTTLWETWIKFLAPVFSLTQPWLLGAQME